MHQHFQTYVSILDPEKLFVEKWAIPLNIFRKTPARSWTQNYSSGQTERHL